MAKADDLAGVKAPVKAFSSNLLKMKFMQRRATQTAAAKQEAQVRASEWRLWFNVALPQWIRALNSY